MKFFIIPVFYLLFSTFGYAQNNHSASAENIQLRDLTEKTQQLKREIETLKKDRYENYKALLDKNAAYQGKIISNAATERISLLENFNYFLALISVAVAIVVGLIAGFSFFGFKTFQRMIKKQVSEMVDTDEFKTAVEELANKQNLDNRIKNTFHVGIINQPLGFDIKRILNEYGFKKTSIFTNNDDLSRVDAVIYCKGNTGAETLPNEIETYAKDKPVLAFGINLTPEQIEKSITAFQIRSQLTGNLMNLLHYHRALKET